MKELKNPNTGCSEHAKGKKWIIIAIKNFHLQIYVVVQKTHGALLVAWESQRKGIVGGARKE